MSSITPTEAQQVADILQGYEHWRKTRAHQIENGSDNQLSVSAYLDEYAKNRALDILTQIEAIYANPELTWQEVDAEIRRLIGVQ